MGNAFYNRYGTKTNAYSLEKRQDVKRLLFIGDSVTSRGKIIDALRQIYGEKEFEYWNAGVESFNTIQEVNFFKKYNATIEPDHVIVTFHLNDFETTPIAFLRNGSLVVYAPNTRLENVSPWLFQHSYIYRLIIGLTVAQEGAGRESIFYEVEDSIAELNSVLAASDIDLTLLIVPYLKPYQEWRPNEMENRDRIIDIVNRNEVRYFDLLSALNEAIIQGVDIQETNGDIWHPSDQLSILFAEFLYERDIF